MFPGGSLPDAVLSVSLFMPPVFSTSQGPRWHKTREKQIAMIAQKVIDANQPHRQGRSFVPSANSRTTTLGALG